MVLEMGETIKLELTMMITPELENQYPVNKM